MEDDFDRIANPSKVQRLATSLKGKMKTVKIFRRGEAEESQMQIRQVENPLWAPKDMFSVKFDDDEKGRAFSGVDGPEQYEGKRCGRLRYFCFGTRQRRLICMSVSLVFIALFSFLGVRASQALQLSNTSPKFSKVSLASLCGNQFVFDIEGTLNNPSAVGATLAESVSKVETGDGVVGLLKTAPIEVPSGQSSFSMQGTFEVCDECVVPLRSSIQKWFDGNRINFTIDLELSAGFDASVFIIPLSVSTSMKIDNYIDSYFDPSLTYEERETLALEAAKRGESMVGSVALRLASDEKVALGVGVNMTRKEVDEETKRKNDEEGFGNYEMNVRIPSLSFKAEVNGEEVALGTSEDFLYGGGSLLDASVELGWKNVKAAEKAIKQYMRQETIPFTLVAQASAEEAPTDSCFLQHLLDGVSLTNKVEFFESVVKYQEEKTKNDPALVQLEGFSVNSIEENGVIGLATNLNLLGAQNFYKFEGDIPPFEVSLLVNSSSFDAREKIGSLSLNQQLKISQSMNPVVNDVKINIDLDNATLFLQLVEQASGLAGNFDPVLFASTTSSTLLGALLESIIISVPLRGSTNGISVSARDSSRLLLSSETKQKNPIEVSFEVSEKFLEFSLDLNDVSKDDLFGYGFMFHETNITLKTIPFAKNSTTVGKSLPFLNARIGGIDLINNELSNVHLSLVVYDDSYGGSFLVDIVERFFLNYDKVFLDISGNYSNKGFEESNVLVKRANWKELRPDGYIDDSDSSVSTFSSLASLKHIEFTELVSNSLQLSTAFELNLQGITANVTLPSIAVGIADCSDSTTIAAPLMNLETARTDIIIGNSARKDDTEVLLNLNFHNINPDVVLQSISKFTFGNGAKLCVVPHAVPSKADFLSKIISSLNFDADFRTPKESSTDGVGAISLDLNIINDDRSACTSAKIDMKEFSQNWTFSLGWGDIEIVAAGGEDSKNQFFSVQGSEGFLGGACNSTYATPSSCSRKETEVEICIFTNNADIQSGAAVTVSSLKQLFVEQTPMDISLSGSTSLRTREVSKEVAVDAKFVIPKNALSTIQGNETAKAGSGSFLKDAHVEVKNLAAGDFFLSTWFVINLSDRIITKLSFPALSFGVDDCSDPSDSSKHLVGVQTSPASFVPKLDSTTMDFEISLADANADDVLFSLSKILSGELVRACVVANPKSNTPTEFLSVVLGGVGLSFDVGNQDSQIVDNSLVELVVTSTANSACTVYSVDMSNNSAVSFGMGSLDWRVLDAVSSSTILSLKVDELFWGRSCDSPFSTASSCSKTSAPIQLCVLTTDGDSAAGARKNGEILSKVIIDKVEQKVSISGTVELRQSKDTVESSALINIPAGALDKLTNRQQNGATGTFIEGLHAELFSMSGTGFQVGTAFELPLGSRKARINFSTVDFGVAECSASNDPVYVAGISARSMSGKFGTVPISNYNELAFDLSLADSLTANVLQVASQAMKGTGLKFCLVKHASISGNFLSLLVGSLGLTFDLEASAAKESILSDVQLTVVPKVNSVCATGTAQLRSTSTSASLSMGWGKNSFAFGDGSNVAFGQFITLDLEPGYLQGTCDSPFAPSKGCTSEQAVKFNICIATNDSDTRKGASTVKSLLTRVFVDQLALPVRVVSQSIDRLLGENSSIQGVADFGLPARAIDIVQGNSGSSPKSESFAAFKHLEVESLVNGLVNLRAIVQANFDLTGINFLLDVPSLSITVSDCTGASSNFLATMTTTKINRNIGSSDEVTVEFPVAVSFDGVDTNKMLDLVGDLRGGMSHTFCIMAPSSGTTFMDRLIDSFDVKIDTTQSVPSSAKTELVITPEERAVCTTIDIDLSGSWATSVGWGRIELYISELTKGDMFFSLGVEELFTGTTCASPFATQSSCGKSSVPIKACVATDKADLNTGADVARDLFQSLVIDQAAMQVKLGGFVSGRMAGSPSQSPISASISIPQNALDKVMQSAPGSSSGFVIADYVDNISLLTVQGDKLNVDVIAKQGGSDFGSIVVTLPEVRARVVTVSGGVEDDFVFLSAALTPKATKLEGGVTVTLNSWARLFETVILFRDNDDVSIKLTRVANPKNFLDRIIPTSILSGPGSSSGGSSAMPGPSGNFDIVAVSTSTNAKLELQFTVLKELSPIPLKWQAESIVVNDAAKTKVGTFALPAASLGPSGTTTGKVLIDLSGTAAVGVATNLFRGNDIGLELKSSSSRWDAGFVLPKELVKALALGTEDSASGISDSILLNEVSILGGNELGSDIILPCLVTAFCENLSIDEKAQTYTGITIGLFFSLPDLSIDRAISFSIELQSKLDFDVDGNGQLMGTLTMMPLKIVSGETGPSKPLKAALTFHWNNKELENLRFIVNRVTTSESLVLGLRGSALSSSNYVSNLLQGIQQDILFQTKATDPNAPPLLGEVDMMLKTAAPKEVQVQATTVLSYLNGPNDMNILLPFGEVKSEIYFQNQRVATADLVPNQADGISFFLKPTSTAQSVGVIAKAFRDVGNGPITNAMNGLFQRFVFSDDIPLKIVGSILPASNAGRFNPQCQSQDPDGRRSAGCGFSLTTWLTYPKVDEQSQFIQDFTINMGSTFLSSIGNVQIDGTKTLYNSLPFDVVISHYSYEIFMYDSDGTNIEYDCTSWRSTACAYIHQWCYLPYTSSPRKKNIVEGGGRVSEGETSTPAKSLLINQPHLKSKGTGLSSVNIDPTLEDAARMWEEFNERGVFCADILAGRMVVGLQPPEGSCNDADKGIDALQCTFVMDLQFEMPNFSLKAGDSCKGPKNAQENLNKPITLDSGFNWGKVVPLPSKIVNSEGTTYWTATKESLIDVLQFEISVNYRADDVISLVFGKDKTKVLSSIFINSIGCNNAGVTGKGTLVRAAVHSLGTSEKANLIVIYDSYTSRVRIGVKHSKSKDYGEDGTDGPYFEYADLDFLPYQEVGSSFGYIGIRHDAGRSDVSFTVSRVKTDSGLTSFLDKAGSNNLTPKVGNIGFLSVQSRDAQGRRRGSGGESFSVTLKNADTGSTIVSLKQVTEAEVRAGPCKEAVDPSLPPLVSCSTSTKLCVCDMRDGTYRVAFNIQTRGRYSMSVSSPSAQTNPNKSAFITERIFVRN